MNIDRLLVQLKEENGVEQQAPAQAPVEQTQQPQQNLEASAVKIQQVVSGGNKTALKDWLTKLAGKKMDSKLVQELKQMIANNVPATEFIERLLQMVENQNTRMRA
jgi:hypothetical protein